MRPRRHNRAGSRSAPPKKGRRHLQNRESLSIFALESGKMQEWLNWPAWKASKPQKGFRGSNPLLSAKQEEGSHRLVRPFLFSEQDPAKLPPGKNLRPCDPTIRWPAVRQVPTHRPTARQPVRRKSPRDAPRQSAACHRLTARRPTARQPVRLAVSG